MDFFEGEYSLVEKEYLDSLEYRRVPNWDVIHIGEPFDVKNSKLWIVN